MTVIGGLVLITAAPAQANCSQVGRNENVSDTYNMVGPNGYRRPTVNAYFTTLTCGYHTSGSLSVGVYGFSGDDAVYGNVRFRTNKGRIVNNPGVSQVGPSTYMAVSNGPNIDIGPGERITQSNLQMSFFQKNSGSAWTSGRRFMSCTFGPEAGNTSGGCVSGSGAGPF